MNNIITLIICNMIKISMMYMSESGWPPYLILEPKYLA